MPTKTDVKRLLSKGLSGREAARLVIQDSWEVDHGREGFLSEKDIQTIRSGLRSSQDAEEYNRLIDAYRVVDYSLQGAHIFALEASKKLIAIERVLWMDTLDYLAGHSKYIRRPAIVTQKQFEELQAKQRERKLQDLTPLFGLLDNRAIELAPSEIEEEWGELEDGPDYFEDYLLQKHPDLGREAIDSVIQLIQSGQLRPVTLSEKDTRRLKALRDKHQEAFDEAIAKGRATLATRRVMMEEHIEQEDNLHLKLYQAGLAKLSQKSLEKIVAALERLKAGSATERDNNLFETTWISGEDLYRAGLPETVRWVDRYTPGFFRGDVPGMSVAIIQDPHKWDVDERGWYKDQDLLIDLLLGMTAGLEERSAKRGRTLQEGLNLALAAAKENIKAFMALRTTLEAVSELLGINVAEDLDKWYEELEGDVEIYNLRAQTPLTKEMGSLKPPKLRLDRLKPTASSIQYFRERIALSLGSNWWEKIAEEFVRLDFPDDSQPEPEDEEEMEEETDGQEA